MTEEFVSNVSVEVSFPFRFRIIESEQVFEEITAYVQAHRTPHREGLPTGDSLFSITDKFQNASYGGKALNQELKDILIHLENKIDVLINLVAQTADPKKEEYPSEGFCKRLSCNEITFSTSEELPDCCGIQVLLSPPSFPPVRVNFTGTLAKEGDLYKATFVGLNTDDREDLLGYLINREREMLRMRKMK